MTLIADVVLDNGLQYVTANAADLHICSQEPTTYAEASSTYTMGNKAGISVSSPQNRTPSGREVVVSTITDGVTTAAGAVTHWAVVSGSELLAVAPIEQPYIVSSGITFTLNAISIGIPDAIA